MWKLKKLSETKRFELSAYTNVDKIAFKTYFKSRAVTHVLRENAEVCRTLAVVPVTLRPSSGQTFRRRRSSEENQQQKAARQRGRRPSSHSTESTEVPSVVIEDTERAESTPLLHPPSSSDDDFVFSIDLTSSGVSNTLTERYIR